MPWTLLLASIGLSACLDTQDNNNCTSSDSTYSCCLKKHPRHPGACGGSEEVESAPLGGKVVAAATAALALSDVDSFQAAQSEIEEILVRCARQAEEEVNRLRLGGRKTSKEECDKVVGKDPNGGSITQAMWWGSEKHDVARACAKEQLGKRIPGSFSLEQRYLYDLSTGRTSLVSPEERARLLRGGKERELVGTLAPDVVIHSGDPLRPWAVYDFKFPCPEENEPSWKRYAGDHPYRGKLQGEMYEKALGRPASRVAPDWGIFRGPTQ